MPIEDKPHANGRPPDRGGASTSLGRLVLGFDGILPDDLDGFVAQRIEILEGLRIAVCNRLVKAIELSDAHMLGRIAYECNYLSVGGTQIATASLPSLFANEVAKARTETRDHRPSTAPATKLRMASEVMRCPSRWQGHRAKRRNAEEVVLARSSLAGGIRFTPPLARIRRGNPAPTIGPTLTRRSETALPGCAYRTRTGETARELSDWI